MLFTLRVNISMWEQTLIVSYVEHINFVKRHKSWANRRRYVTR